MRIDVRKKIFIGASNNRAIFFQKAQKAGIIEFIPSPSSQKGETPPEISHILSAIKILRAVTPVKEQITNLDASQADGIAQEILKEHRLVEQCQEEMRILSQEIVRVEAFGDFSPEQLHELEEESGYHFQFFHGKQGAFTDMETYPELLYISSENSLDYFVAINKEPKSYPKLIEMHIDQPVGQLKQRLAKAREGIHEAEQKLKEHNRYNQFLHWALGVKMDEYHLEEAEESADLPMEKRLFAIEGWVPENKEEELAKLMGDLSVYAEEIAVESEDRVPTYLENRGLSRVGEDLVHIYDTPAPTDKDPSLWVLWAFAFFFAIIIADAGYGLLFFIGALFCHFKYGKRVAGMKKRILKLALLLGASCIIWGSLTNAFFGIQLAPNNPLRKISLIDWLTVKKATYQFDRKDEGYQELVKQYPSLAQAKTPQEFLLGAPTMRYGTLKYPVAEKYSDRIMFELALFIGVIHLSLSCLRYLRHHWAGFGWMLFMIGGYLYFPAMLHATSLLNFAFGISVSWAHYWGLIILYSGMGLAVILALLQKRWGGLSEIVNVIQVFCDVLSYLRLYALGLAGSIMAQTFNEMAVLVGGIFAPIILLAGHLVNIALGLMSGVIHGLRLNFLEWYHYSFEGGGKLFKPLALLQKQKQH